jgi:alcohol dehydrogenase
VNIADLTEIRIPRTIFGVGALTRLAGVAKDLGAKNILVITDQGVARAGIVRKVLDALATGGLRADVFDRTEAEGPVSTVDAIAEMAIRGRHNLLIGVGGGSVMDVTKAVGHLVANPGLSALDLINSNPTATGQGDAAPPAPAWKSINKILIPTTSGTGSEWSIIAVVTDDRSDDRNYAFAAETSLPKAVILDPALTFEVPPAMTAESGVDALMHAIEAYTSHKANVFTDMCARTAIELIAGSLRPAVAKGSVNVEDRYRLALASSLAMLAGSRSGVSLAHFMSHAYRELLHERDVHVSHGAKVGLMAPYVMEFNAISNPAKFADVARLLGENTRGLSPIESALRAPAAVRALLTDLGMPQHLSEIRITEADIPYLVEELMTYQAAQIAAMNPRDVTPADAADIFRQAL